MYILNCCSVSRTKGSQSLILKFFNSHLKERGACVGVTMALLYSFNPCQAWALRKSALVFAWFSSRACKMQQKYTAGIKFCLI